MLPGAQTPLQPPDTQAWLPQSIGAPHWPVESHTSTLLPEHWIAPGEQGMPLSGEASVVPGDPSRVPSWLAPTSATVASGASASGTVESPGSGGVDPSSPPLLLPEPVSPEESGPPPTLTLLPPQATTRLAASAPTKANRIQRLESIMGPLGNVGRIADAESRRAVLALYVIAAQYHAVSCRLVSSRHKERADEPRDPTGNVYTGRNGHFPRSYVAPQEGFESPRARERRGQPWKGLEPSPDCANRPGRARRRAPGHTRGSFACGVARASGGRDAVRWLGGHHRQRDCGLRL